ncbi:MAG TPA: hypothetical protein VLA34_14830, partial [Candidatus Krumholzibacterium sp.]|nr:hypothetical protein [Candidatus Krumholzibacterium sp.]
GHVLTTGMPQRVSGLAAVLQNRFRIFPCDLRCDMFDTSPQCLSQAGMYSMAYEDFCVTMLDKVEAVLKTWLPFNRSKDLDAMRYAELDMNDPVTLMHPGLPKKLELWSVVTQPGMFFDPNVQGFLYLEAYDPEYWMRYKGATSQECFHPMYRARAIVTRSVMDKVPVAFWTTKYADVVTPGNLNVAAPSVHFGVPLWFFNRGQVDSITTVIFEEWQILD